MREKRVRTELRSGFNKSPCGVLRNAPSSREPETDNFGRTTKALGILAIARSLLDNLSVASSYDDRIDSSSAGVAEIAGRLIAEAVAELNPTGAKRTEDSATTEAFPEEAAK
jgi:hypothetical protein